MPSGALGRLRNGRSSDRLAAARAQIENAALILCDLDGCLVAGGKPCDGAAEFVERHGERLRIVSNNSTHSATRLASELASMGLRVRAEQCVLAGEVAVAHVLRRYPGAKVQFLGSADLCERLRAEGLRVVAENPDVVLVCRDLDLRFDSLQRAVTAAYRGAPIVAANPDPSHPDSRGEPQLETGAILAAIRSAVPQAAVTVIGKPAPELFLAATRGMLARRALVIGDNPDTDIEGARTAGIPSILIGKLPSALARSLRAFSH
ncbi:MAG TPA: HAD-IIA family hydrolase [Burkholderiales bacterium]|nr:HAD-IIA family hydrolase [Burkholderiales bacterium]